MLTLKEWMELVEYRITEGSMWYEYGPGVYSFSYWNGDHDGHSSNIVFETSTQKVLQVEVCDYKNNRAYRRLLGTSEHEEAWDGVKFVNLESDDDFMQKAMAIFAGEEYDTRVTVPIELPDEELFTLMKLAHERDITFNQLCEQAIMEMLKKHDIELANEYGVYQ